MTLNNLYRKAIEIGIANDPRSKEIIEAYFQTEQKKFDKMSEKEKKYYDTDKLFNPYSDTRILNGNTETEINKVMVGIDLEIGELLLANTLNKEESNKIDLLISHHPEGKALAGLYEVMDMHADIFEQLGITVSTAEHIMKKRIGEVERSLNSSNYNRAVDAAKTLNFPFMCMHTVADNCVSTYLTNLFKKENPYKLKDIIDLLLDIEEYNISAKNGVFPKIINGSDNNRCGKIHIDMTGGTDTDKDMISQYIHAGVSTLICMHVKESHLEEAKKSSLNMIVAGHIACDVLGLNLLFDEIEKESSLDFVSVSGFNRIRASNR